MNREAQSGEAPSEPDVHVGFRRARTLLRYVVLAGLVATIALLMLQHPAAYLIAFPLPVLIVLLAIVRYYERQSRASAVRKPDQKHVGEDEVEIDVEGMGVFTLLGVVVLIALGTFVIAAAYFDWEIVGIAAAAILFLALLINIPYIPLLVTEARRDERAKVTDQTDR